MARAPRPPRRRPRRPRDAESTRRCGCHRSLRAAALLVCPTIPSSPANSPRCPPTTSASSSRRLARRRCTPRSRRLRPVPATIAAPKTASPGPRSALTPGDWRSTSWRSRSPTNGVSSLSGRPARTKRPTFARCGRRLAAGSPPSSVPAQIRFTPTTCTSTSNSMVRARATAFANKSCVLRDSIAKRPVFPFDLDQADEDVLPPQAERSREPVGDRLIKRLLLLDRPALVPGNLDDHQVVAAANVEIVRIEDEIVGIVLIDHLEAVVFRHADADQRLVNDAADGRAIGVLLAFAQIDANERHGLSPDGLGFRPLKRGLRAKIVLTFDLKSRLWRAPAYGLGGRAADP